MRRIMYFVVDEDGWTPEFFWKWTNATKTPQGTPPKTAYIATTDDLLAELEKRRPCKECVSWRHNSTPCMTCFWKWLWNMGEALHTDNFKAQGGK